MLESNMKIPKISIVLPAYNAERTIKESIETIFSQSYQDWELVIVDDCSCDKTLDIIQTSVVNDQRVTILHNEINLGVAASRNKAVAVAKGEWIAFLDADDLWHKNKLKKQVEFIEQHQEIVLLYTAINYMDASGNMYKYVMQAEEQIGFNQLLHKNILICSSVLVRKDIMIQIPMKDGCLHEDYLEWLEITKSGRYLNGLNEPLVIYRLQDKSRSSNRLKAAYMSYNTYRAVGFNMFYAIYLVICYAFYSVRKRNNIRKT